MRGGSDAGLALLRLMQLVSPALPVGAFSYSRGLEAAHTRGTVIDEASALAWIAGVGRELVTHTDGPLLLRLHAAHASADADGVAHWEATCTALRETRELWLEEQRMGAALFRLLGELGVPEARGRKGPYTSAFALWACHHGIDAQQALLGYLWAFAESQVSVAVRLIPLGQTAGQRILSALLPELSHWAQLATDIEDADVGQTGPGLAHASAHHELQYSRLFRS